MDRFQLAQTLFGVDDKNKLAHSERDLYMLLAMLSDLYRAGAVSYICSEDAPLKNEVVAQLRKYDDYYCERISQRMIGKGWEKRICDFGLGQLV